MHQQQAKRGRPRTYDFEARRSLADLIRIHGARGARRELRNSVSLATLLKIAREFHIELKPGRRAA